MTRSHEFLSNPRQYAEQVLVQSQRALRKAVGIVYPENPLADPLLVFPAPNEVRAEDKGLSLTEEQELSLRAVAVELGFGRAENVTLSQQGLRGSIVVIEGGQPHRIMAEALTVATDVDADPAIWFFAASNDRQLTSPAEIDSANRLFGLGQAGRTEYEIAMEVIRATPDFKERSEPIELVQFSYDINNNFALCPEQSGQFMMVGYNNGQPVNMMRIDRHNYVDEKGAKRYRNQPGTADVIRILDRITEAHGNGDLPLALVTSSTYAPSRTVAVARAGLAANRRIGLATYGNDMLNAIKDTNDPPPFYQLPGELYHMAKETAYLEAELGNAG